MLFNISYIVQENFMKKLQMFVVLFFVIGGANIGASDFYSKPDTSRASKTVRNTPEKPKAKEQYLKEAQAGKITKPKTTKEVK